jgi:hypothetical protein
MMKMIKRSKGIKGRSGHQHVEMRGYQPTQEKPKNVDKTTGTIKTSVKNNGNVAQNK